METLCEIKENLQVIQSEISELCEDVLDNWGTCLVETNDSENNVLDDALFNIKNDTMCIQEMNDNVEKILG